MQVPTVGELVQSVVVQEALEDAWQDSLPMDRQRRHEEGGSQAGPAFPLDTFGFSELKHMGNAVISSVETELTSNQILAIAEADATSAYRDLSSYRIQLVREADGWHVDFDLKDPRLTGGGPHYVIHPTTGVIISKRYEQ